MSIAIESVFKDAQIICDEVVNDRLIYAKITQLAVYIIAGSAMYGFVMGIRHSTAQALASSVKVPMLFFITLLICLPTLHFIGLLLGSRIQFTHSVVVLLMGVSVTAILLAAFAPISLFFLISGSRYEFLLLLHVAIFAFCGLAGLMTIHRNLKYIRRRAAQTPYKDVDNLASENVRRTDFGAYVFWVWMALYMFVGSQMAYVLAPFVGRDSVFMLFHTPQDNFYTYLWNVVVDLLQ